MYSQKIIVEFGDYEVGQRENVDAQGGLACLAQARQNRPGIGELDLTNIPIVT